MSDVFFAGGTDVEFQIWDFRFEISAVISFFLLGEPMEVAGGTRGPGLVHRVLKLLYKNPLGKPS